MTHDHGATLSDLKDQRRTRYERKQAGRTWAKILLWTAIAAALAGFGGQAAWWVLGVVLSLAALLVAIWNR